jgi:hypothetical protein
VLFKPSEVFVPGIYSRPMSDDDPDIAPSLILLRETLMVMTGRPNIRHARGVIQLRGGLTDQPYDAHRKPSTSLGTRVIRLLS